MKITVLNRPLIQLIIVRYKEFIREPGIVFWSIIFPILMAWVLGIAFSRPNDLIQQVGLIENKDSVNARLRTFLEDADTVYSDQDPDGYHYEKNIRNDKLGRTVYKFLPADRDEGFLMLKRGRINILVREYPDSLQYYFDPRNPQARMMYVLLAATLDNENLAYETAGIRPLTQQGNRYIDFLVPGLLAMGVMNSLLWGISYALIEMRSKKLLRRMIATPMKKTHFLVSHFAARLSLTVIEAMILYLFAVIYFKIRIQGSIVALAMVFLAGNIAFSGIAVLISARTANSRIGTGLINVISLPMMVLSGIFFSYHNFPDAVIPVIRKMPLTMMADSIRGVFIEGFGIAQVGVNSLILTVIGLTCFAIGLRFYKWY